MKPNRFRRDQASLRSIVRVLRKSTAIIKSIYHLSDVISMQEGTLDKALLSLRMLMKGRQGKVKTGLIFDGEQNTDP